MVLPSHAAFCLLVCGCLLAWGWHLLPLLGPTSGRDGGACIDGRSTMPAHARWSDSLIGMLCGPRIGTQNNIWVFLFLGSSYRNVLESGIRASPRVNKTHAQSRFCSKIEKTAL
jgi:hypothetical protein